MPALVRVLLLYNPISGSGRSAQLAARLAPVLEQAELARGTCIELESAQTRLEPPSEWLDKMLDGVDLLVVVGGDGAMRLVAESLVRTGVAVFHYPAGTENLFAREFGMEADPGRLVDAIRADRYESIDILRVEGRIALLCASIGLDAEVVHDLAEHRSGSIRHVSYIKPLLRQLRSWRRSPPRFTIEMDGDVLVEASPGFMLIANSNQYAMRLDPARDADVRDGLLDVVHLPACSVTRLAIWGLRCRLGRQLRHPEARYVRGRRVVVRSDQPCRIQVDGDALQSEGPTDTLVVEVEPAALRVLCPEVRETSDPSS